jgi:hypothetical protein
MTRTEIADAVTAVLIKKYPHLKTLKDLAKTATGTGEHAIATRTRFWVGLRQLVGGMTTNEAVEYCLSAKIKLADAVAFMEWIDLNRKMFSNDAVCQEYCGTDVLAYFIADTLLKRATIYNIATDETVWYIRDLE